jgi:hypothetical protein
MKRISRLAAVALAIAAVAAPAASARPAADPPVDNGSGSQIAPVVQSADDGLDWASAAIGAGAAGAIAVLIGVGGTSLRHRHEQIGIAR